MRGDEGVRQTWLGVESKGVNEEDLLRDYGHTIPEDNSGRTGQVKFVFEMACFLAGAVSVCFITTFGDQMSFIKIAR